MKTFILIFEIKIKFYLKKLPLLKKGFEDLNSSPF